MNNPLNRHPKLRQALLDVQWGVTGLQTVGSVLFVFMHGDNLDAWPVWFLASLAVAPALWGYLGFTARNNVKGTDAEGLPLSTEVDL